MKSLPGYDEIGVIFLSFLSHIMGDVNVHYAMWHHFCWMKYKLRNSRFIRIPISILLVLRILLNESIQIPSAGTSCVWSLKVQLITTLLFIIYTKYRVYKHLYLNCGLYENLEIYVQISVELPTHFSSMKFKDHNFPRVQSGYIDALFISVRYTRRYFPYFA